jgi:hypothetical protein
VIYQPATTTTTHTGTTGTTNTTPVATVVTFAGVPTGVSVEATGASGAPVSYPMPNASDSVAGALTPTCAPAPGSTFGIGTTTVTCSAKAPSGSSGSATFPVTVQDTSPPDFSGVPSPPSVKTNAHQSVSVDYAMPKARDVVDGTVSVTCDPESGSSFALGKTTVTCTATDAHGNKGTATFPVTVVDTTPPPPIGLLVGRTSGAFVGLSWKLPGGGDVRGFEVWRTPGGKSVGATSGPKPPGALVYKGARPGYNDRTTKPGAWYAYRVRGFDWAGNTSSLSAPLLAWRAVANASYYNIQLYRNGKKILSTWPTATHLLMSLTWKYEGKSYKLTPGKYECYVWPGFGAISAAKYGAGLSGPGNFIVAR